MPLLRKGRLIQSLVDLATENLDRGGHVGQRSLLVGLGVQLTLLELQDALLLLDLRSFAFEFRPVDDFPQIDIQQTGFLSTQMRQRLPEGLPLGLQRLGQPLSTLGALQGSDRVLRRSTREEGKPAVCTSVRSMILRARVPIRSRRTAGFRSFKTP